METSPLSSIDLEFEDFEELREELRSCLDEFESPTPFPAAATRLVGPSALALRVSPSALALRVSPSALALRVSPSALALRVSPSALALAHQSAVVEPIAAAHRRSSVVVPHPRRQRGGQKRRCNDQLQYPKPSYQHHNSRALQRGYQHYYRGPPRETRLFPHQYGQPLPLGCRIPESLSVVTRLLSRLGFPRYSPRGVQLETYDYVPELVNIQASCDFEPLYAGVDSAVETALECLTGTWEQIVEYPEKRQLAVEALGLLSTKYYQQALLAYSFPLDPKGILDTLFDFTTAEQPLYHCPTPETNLIYLQAKIKGLEYPIQRAEKSRRELYEAEGVSHSEFVQPSHQLVILTSQREELALTAFKLQKKLLLPILTPFGTLPHPKGWPVILCQSLDQWIASEDYKK